MNIGMLIFPNVTQLDFTAPHEVFARCKNFKISVIAKSLAPVIASDGLSLNPNTTLDSSPDLDLLFVPGGPRIGELMADLEILNFLRQQEDKARYITSVCTGALLLGAAGLLQGYRAATHWLSMDLLTIFGATAVPERIVIDRNRITAGGVTAGIDFALQVISEISGEEEAKKIQLLIEYNPQPPFQSGHPSVADPKLVEKVYKERKSLQEQLKAQAMHAAQLFCKLSS